MNRPSYVPVRDCLCGRMPEVTESYSPAENRQMHRVRCPRCKTAFIGVDEWNLAMTPKEPEPPPRTDGDSVTRDLLRASELLHELADIAERIAGVPR